MNTIFEVVKHKTDIKGFWKDDKGKIYIDNIKLCKINNTGEFEAKLYLLFNQGEKSIFITTKQNSFIVYPNGSFDKFSKLTMLERDHISFNEVKSFINSFGGLSIRKVNNKYILTIWSK